MLEEDSKLGQGPNHELLGGNPLRNLETEEVLRTIASRGSIVQGQADAVVSVLLRLGTQKMSRPPVSAVDISTARPGVNDPVFVLK